MNANRTQNVQQLTMEINYGVQPPATMIRTRSGEIVQCILVSKHYRVRW